MELHTVERAIQKLLFCSARFITLSRLVFLFVRLFSFSLVHLVHYRIWILLDDSYQFLHALLQIMVTRVIENFRYQQRHSHLVVPIKSPGDIFLGEYVSKDMSKLSLHIHWRVFLKVVTACTCIWNCLTQTLIDPVYLLWHILGLIIKGYCIKLCVMNASNIRLDSFYLL